MYCSGLILLNRLHSIGMLHDLKCIVILFIFSSLLCNLNKLLLLIVQPVSVLYVPKLEFLMFCGRPSCLFFIFKTFDFDNHRLLFGKYI